MASSSMTTSSQCPLWHDKPEQCTTLLTVTRVFSSLSLVGSLLVLITIMLLKTYKAFVQKLVLSLSISALISSATYIAIEIPPDTEKSTTTCKFQGFLMQYFDWSTLLWVCVMASNMFMVVLRGKNLSLYFRWLHCFVWLFSLFWAVIPLFGDKYGSAGIWCWIKEGNLALRFGTWYGPLFFLSVCMLGMYMYVIYNVYETTRVQSGHSEFEQTANRLYRKELRPLLFYPLIYISFYIPTFIYRIEDATHPDKPPKYVLAILSAIFVPSISVCYAVSYAIFNYSVRELTWLKLKLGFLSLFTSQYDVTIRDYTVDDVKVLNYQDIPPMQGTATDNKAYDNPYQ